MSKLVQLSIQNRRIGSAPATFSNPDPLFGELVSDLSVELKNVASSGDRAITQAQILERSILFLEKRIAELDADRQSETRAKLIILSRELGYYIADLKSAVREVRNNTIAFELMNSGRQ